MIAFDSGLVYNSMECKHVQVSAGLQARIIEYRKKKEKRRAGDIGAGFD